MFVQSHAFSTSVMLHCIFALKQQAQHLHDASVLHLCMQLRVPITHTMSCWETGTDCIDSFTAFREPSSVLGSLRRRDHPILFRPPRPTSTGNGMMQEAVHAVCCRVATATTSPVLCECNTSHWWANIYRQPWPQPWAHTRKRLADALLRRWTSGRGDNSQRWTIGGHTTWPPRLCQARVSSTKWPRRTTHGSHANRLRRLSNW